MNILYILGNGFDKAQGLATSYQEFYREYEKIEPVSELEARLKKDIQSDYETWADLEEGLGKYSAQFTDVNAFRDVIRILNFRLKDYLKTQALKISTLGLSKDIFQKNLLAPDLELEEKQRAEYEHFYSHFRTETIYVDCVTFNYTNTFEAVGGKGGSFFGFVGGHSVQVFLNRCLHLHGSLDDMILVGVNDVSQIANESFRENAELREEFVKPEINNGCENMMNETFSQLIQNAQVIVLFGVSVGKTDSMWWQIIGRRLDNPADNLRLIYYPYDKKKDTEQYPFRKLRWAKEYINFLKDRMDIQSSVDELRERIYVGINKKYLNLGRIEDS